MKQTESLKKNYEFSLLYKKGEYYVGRHMTLYTLATRRGTRRIGITVSRKAVRKSTKRNRIRRLIKECYRLYENSITSNKDMVFVVRKTEILPEYAEIKKEMKYLLSVSGLIGEHEEI
ncbi:MAG: ribonuclease P protein component [Clostridia bacterium]